MLKLEMDLIEILKFNENLKKSFSIENCGTLKQNLSIGLQITDDIPEDATRLNKI